MKCLYRLGGWTDLINSSRGWSPIRSASHRHLPPSPPHLPAPQAPTDQLHTPEKDELAAQHPSQVPQPSFKTVLPAHWSAVALSTQLGVITDLGNVRSNSREDAANTTGVDEAEPEKARDTRSHTQTQLWTHAQGPRNPTTKHNLKIMLVCTSQLRDTQTSSPRLCPHIDELSSTK